MIPTVRFLWSMYEPPLWDISETQHLELKHKPECYSDAYSGVVWIKWAGGSGDVFENTLRLFRILVYYSGIGGLRWEWRAGVRAGIQGWNQSVEMLVHTLNRTQSLRMSPDNKYSSVLCRYLVSFDARSWCKASSDRNQSYCQPWRIAMQCRLTAKRAADMVAHESLWIS